MEILYGKNTVFEYLNADKPKREISHIYIREGLKDLNILKDLANKKKYKCSVLDSKDFNNLLQKNKLSEKNHQGALLFCSNYFYSSMNDLFLKMNNENNIIVFLDNITDSRNFGGIIRTCASFNVSGIIVKEKNSVLVNPNTSKTALGFENYVSIVRVNNMLRAINEAKKNNFWIFGLDIDGKPLLSEKSKMENNIAFVVGSEDKGISKLILDNLDFKIKIPMNEKINSLNASIALSIALYEANRK